MLLTPGHVLAERYRVIGPLGQGGMAAVYYAHDRSLDRLVAIKQLRPDPTASEKAIKQTRLQFLREAQVLATLDHPNLPRVTDYFTRDDIECLVMDYVEGQSLIEVIQKNGKGLDDTQVLDWADQLLSALDYIHRHGVIHRDVKPANIRLTPDGRIFLVDFGLVKQFDPDNPKTATIMHGLGTPEYAPPEQYDSRLGHTDPRSDLYALGATLYHLFTGQAPETVTQRVADPKSFRRPRALGAQISVEVEQAILRAMELQPVRRFDNAAEMRAALKLARRASVPAGLTQRLPRWAFQERRVLTRRVAPLAVFALLIVGGGIWLANGVQPPTDTLTPSPTSAIPVALPTATSTRTPTQTFTLTSSPAAPTGTLTQTAATPTPLRSPTLTLTEFPLDSESPTSPDQGTPGGGLTKTPAGQGTPTGGPTRTPPGQGTPGGGLTKTPSGQATPGDGPPNPPPTHEPKPTKTPKP